MQATERLALDEIGLVVSDAEVRRTLEPYARHCAADDPEWNARAAHLAKKWKRKRRLRNLRGRIAGLGRYLPARNMTFVEDEWNRLWGRSASKFPLDPSTTRWDTAIWGDARLMIRKPGRQRVQVLYLMRAIELLKPRRVLDVGCGVGRTLMLLANRFPDTACNGVELTAEGVAQADQSAQLAELPPDLVAYSPEPLVSKDAHRRVVVQQSSAAALPFPDDHFDLVYTVQSLEQMESIRDEVLRELARVSSGYILMFEPWRDWNQSDLQRDRIAAKDYFQARVDELGRYGLEPVFASGNIPSKLGMVIGLVVARVRSRSDGLDVGSISIHPVFQVV
jgi:SAM-dependent methyltransferase